MPYSQYLLQCGQTGCGGGLQWHDLQPEGSYILPQIQVNSQSEVLGQTVTLKILVFTSFLYIQLKHISTIATNWLKLRRNKSIWQVWEQLFTLIVKSWGEVDLEYTWKSEQKEWIWIYWLLSVGLLGTHIGVGLGGGHVHGLAVRGQSHWGPIITSWHILSRGHGWFYKSS